MEGSEGPVLLTVSMPRSEGLRVLATEAGRER